MSAIELSQLQGMLEKVRVLGDGPVRTVVLHNPARKNAIGPQMVNELLHVFEALGADPSARVIVLTGEGEAFCAGGDFSQMTGSGAAEAPRLEPKGDYADLLLAMARYEKPIVARVRGPAMGGGLGLVASCTFALAGEDAVFATPEINVGLFPMMIMAVLSRLVPRRTLTRMMLTGVKLSANEALGAGLLTNVVAPSALDTAVTELSDALVKKSPLTMALGLRAFAKQEDMSLEQALPYLRGCLGEVLATNDAREGLMAFLEKRHPQWTGT
jgi:enoyl-CoA hydratase/carnithine racemase